MTIFWLIVAALILLALALTLPALFTSKTKFQQNQLNRQEQNIQIAREKIETLNNDYQRGTIDKEELEASKKELEFGLIDDVDQDSDAIKEQAKPSLISALVIAVFIPVASYLLYLELGNPAAVNVEAMSQNTDRNAQNNLTAMLSQLKAKLQTEPEDQESWMLLGRTYMTEENFKEADIAYTKLLSLAPGNPDYMLLKADSLAMLAGGQITDEAEELIKGALEKDPENYTGLWLAGMAARSAGDNTTALKHWEKLRGLMPANSPDIASLDQLISEIGGTASNSAPNPQHELPDIAEMVTKLKQKLDAEPNNPVGWAMLGKSYMVMKRFDEAESALTEAVRQSPEDVETLLTLADVVAVLQDGKTSGRSQELIFKALTLDANNPKALWLAGIAEQQNGNDQKAVVHWNKLLPLIQEDPDAVNEVKSLIEEAGGTVLTQDTTPVTAPNTETADADGAYINVAVQLSDEFKDKASPEDIVFIYAKAANGPPMPLAAARKQVKDLPLMIKLTDSMAMTPQAKLSNYQQVIVGARISQSGQAISQAGDFYSESAPVALGSAVRLTIDTVK